jgi:L-cysteine S-thiosulfotransferase
MRAPRHARVAGLAALGLALAAGAARDEAPVFTAAEKRSGSTFLSPALKAQHDDEGANPGMLWVAEGEKLWTSSAGASGKSCASCHGEAAASMKGAAARHPEVDAASGQLMNLELRINQCRTQRQGAPALEWESSQLLALTAYVAFQSRGLPVKVAIDGPARPHFEAGRAFFMTRQGQLNLACSQCHDENWGRQLRGDTISQGHPTGFPIYRLEWQSAGSLQRRLRACSLGVRAEVLDYGAPEYLALELYLAWRAEGLPIEAPALRP